MSKNIGNTSTLNMFSIQRYIFFHDAKAHYARTLFPTMREAQREPFWSTWIGFYDSANQNFYEISQTIANSSRELR